MIANGILFKADFDMSKFEDNQILKQFNPTKLSTYKEDIQATKNVEVIKESNELDKNAVVLFEKMKNNTSKQDSYLYFYLMPLIFMGLGFLVVKRG